MSATRLISRLVRLGSAAALMGGVASICAYLLDTRTFFSAWLAAFHFWLAMPLGALALLLIWDLTGGRWERLARTPLCAMAATMPLFVLLFFPLVPALSDLFPWARPQVAATLHNRWYLNPSFFYGRACVYFVIWNALALWRAFQPTRPQWVSAIGLLLMLYTMTYAGIDWILSTEPRWFSSIFGMIVCSGQLIAALAATLLLILSKSRPAEREQTTFTATLASLSAILLAAVTFWVYAEFCQWLIIWEENLRTEIPWYIERWRQPWASVIYALVAAQFAVPFALLVWGPTKRNPRIVGPVCALLVFTSMLHVWWLLLPGLPAIRFSWIHPAVMLGVGGLWLLAVAAVLTWTGRRENAPEPTSEGFIHG